MLVSGLRYPIYAAGVGAAWSAARVMYALGYTSSKGPQGRTLYVVPSRSRGYPICLSMGLLTNAFVNTAGPLSDFCVISRLREWRCGLVPAGCLGGECGVAVYQEEYPGKRVKSGTGLLSPAPWLLLYSRVSCLYE
jgi:hypothetical protein